MMLKLITSVAAISFLFGCNNPPQPPSLGHAECEKQFKQLSHGAVIEVPEVPDWGDSREYYFAWNHGSKSSPIKTTSGTVGGACVINKQTGKGYVTLGKEDLGEFTADAPL